MANLLPTLSYTTPEEFINYYYDQLKTELGVFDLQISKVGFIGFFMNLLGYTHFDLKQYYDSLFKEAFIGTSQTEESQYIHAATYGYIPTFAIASSAVGTIEFDMVDWLPRRTSGVVRREVIVGYSSSSGVIVQSDAKFFIDNFQFTIDALYKFIEIEDNGVYYYSADVITADGTKLSIPSSTSTISVPLYSTTQYSKKEISFVLKPYNFGSFQTYYFGIDSGYYLSDLQVFVTPAGSTAEEEYQIKYTKYLEKGDSNSVFLRKVTSTSYVIEFGSGIRGNWISGASIRLIIKSTRGTAGNLIDKTNLKIQIVGNVLAYDYEYAASGELTPTGSLPSVSQQPLIDFDYSEAGADPLSGEDLRDAIVNFIQTRDNMISQQDFYNIAADYFDDFKFLFKKFNVFDNIFHLCRAYRDRNQSICYTLNHNKQVLDLNSTSDPTYVPTAAAVAGGSLPDDTYGYFVVAIDEWGQSAPSAIVTATTSGTDNSVKIDWSAVPYATKYRVYGRMTTFRDQYWEVNAPTVTYTDDGTVGTPVIEPVSYELQPLFYRPTFSINGETFISPFIYKGETRMNYYNGHILKDLSRIDFADVVLDEAIIGTGFDVPVVYLNLDYDETTFKTTIYLKSYQVISNLVFTISVYGSNLNIANKRMECFPLSSNQFAYVYDDADTYGLFEDEIQIEIKCGISDSILTNNYSTFNTVGANVLKVKVNDSSPYPGAFTTITLTAGAAVTAATLITEINTQLGRTIASSYTDDNGNVRIKLTPPALAGAEVTQNIFIALTGSTCLTALGLTGNDTIPAVLNGPLTTLKFTNTTNKFYQLEDISDQLKLVRYQSGADSYIVNIPVMYNATFVTDPDYYLDKFRNFIMTAVFNENRMVTDNVQCRVLNSYYVQSPFIESIFLQGGEIFSEVYYNHLDPVIDTRNTPPTVALTGQKFRVGTAGVGAFSGHDNEIATYNGSGWDFYTPVYIAGLQQDFVLDSDVNICYRWDGTNWISLPVIELPFKMRVEVKCDKTYIQRNSVDLPTEKENLNLAVAEYLQKSFSGSNIVFYNSLITEFVHTNRAYVKSVKVYVTDSSATPSKLDNGIEILGDDTILSNLKDKLDIVKYSPIMVHWDVENLDIVMAIE
jgi:hypothetical protein